MLVAEDLSLAPIPHQLWGGLEKQPVSSDWLMQGYQNLGIRLKVTER